MYRQINRITKMKLDNICKTHKTKVARQQTVG